MSITARIVPLQVEHRSEVERIMWSTYFLGQPLGFPLSGRPRFGALHLDWFFTYGLSDSVIVIDDAGSVIGYCLVCTDPDHHGRWIKRRSLTTTLLLVGRMMTGGMSRPSIRFYWWRLRDAIVLGRHHGDLPRAGHVHVNLLPGHRDGTVSRRIRDHMDERCQAANLDGWLGEINARRGKRTVGLERIGGTILATHRNLTFTALVGEPISRHTMYRKVPARTGTY